MPHLLDQQYAGEQFSSIFINNGFVLGLQRQAPPEIFKVSLLGGLWSPKGKHAGESKAFPPQMQSQITPPVCRVEQRYLSISNSAESCVCFVSVDHWIRYAPKLCT